jgi:flagellum-specific peptidoglycan hydrolase FlgJ
VGGAVDRERDDEVMDPLKRLFISNCVVACNLADHPYPEMAACEAALESRYGESLLALRANNLFGMKQHSHPIFGTLNLPTREFKGGAWIVIDANFVEYPGVSDCFKDRLATLTRLSQAVNPNTGQLEFPHYKNALAASDPETFVREVSQTWSTDPDRAEHIIQIYNDYMAALAQQA